MKKLKLMLLMAMTMSLTVFGCGKGEDTVSNNVIEQIDINPVTTDITADPVVSDNEVSEDKVTQPPEGMYASELTGEWIDESLKMQRPVCIMVDNEITALDHYGVNSADIVYEMMNSTLNGRITRLMCVVKDWKNIEKFGSVRSTRPTNVMLSMEYNSILIHDGGPFMIQDYLNMKYALNLSGGFARFSNGKATEYTEYVTAEAYTNPTTGKSYSGLIQRIADAGYSESYTDLFPGIHWLFNSEGVDLTTNSDCTDVKRIDLPFEHNSSELNYNEETKKYEYSEYGMPHVDAGDDNKQTCFENVIVQKCDFFEYGEGYMCYNIIGSGEGYYITEGKCIPVKWEKVAEHTITKFFNAETGEYIELNPGKTYIAIVPSDVWGKLVLE